MSFSTDSDDPSRSGSTRRVGDPIPPSAKETPGDHVDPSVRRVIHVDPTEPVSIRLCVLVG